ncbi:MAG: NADH-quinone oxidoreductase subunit G [Beggiatoa sp. IS2]|nr:MAG: NADH-quinone oxidoreductase subunit G [Beggiatoa sp. IS2]
MAIIEIDGKPYEATPGQMLIEVADANGIDIPRFCYHKKLSVSASCRMCLVEVVKAPKPLPACATPVADGMQVFTRSTRALTAQKAVMEFLLINHPLDCPICDQGGECELQDIAVGYGKGQSRYREEKRVVFDKSFGPLIATEMTRCIHCTRCVRFGVEISGTQELGTPGRGEHTRIGTYIEKSVNSELSGNVIDLCPVGALTSKPFRFSSRSWEMQQYDGIAPHDAVGSHIHFHVKRNKVLRVVPKENEAINEVWISDRDRFSYQGLSASDRLTTPMIKQNGVWQATDWENALIFAVDGLKKVINTYKEGGNSVTGLKQIVQSHKRLPVAALASSSATVEELYLLQKLMRGIGSDNIDHRLRQVDFSDQQQAPLFPSLGQSIADLEQCEAALIIGSHLRKEQPLINHRLRKATLAGAKVMVINPLDYEFNYPLAAQIITSPATLPHALAGIAKILIKDKNSPESLRTELAKVTVEETHRFVAQQLQNGGRAAVLLGSLATAHPQFALIHSLAMAIAEFSGAKLGYLTEGANTAGAWLAGVLPHRSAGGVAVKSAGNDAHTLLTHGSKAFVLLGTEPELDSCNGSIALETLKKAEFVVSLSAYRTAAMESYANVLLPISLFAETSGTYINLEGQWQSFSGAVNPPGETRPGWKVLRVLGNLFDLEGFDYIASDQICEELRQKIGKPVENKKDWQITHVFNDNDTTEGLQRITEMPIYAVDSLVRRANALQCTHDGKIAQGIHVNSKIAGQRNLTAGVQVQVRQGVATVTLPLVIDNRVPDGCALIYGGQLESVALGTWQGQIELSVVA